MPEIPDGEIPENPPLPPRQVMVHFYRPDTMEYDYSSRIAEGSELPPNATWLDPQPSRTGYVIKWAGEFWDQIPTPARQ